MFLGKLNFSKAEHYICGNVVPVIILAHLLCVGGIPINFGNNNNYKENHGNRPILPNQPPVLPQRPPYLNKQPHQNSQNQGPEIEDLGRFHTNQNQFRRHAIPHPDVKVTQGAFQQNPSLQFVKNGGVPETETNFRHSMFDESSPQQQQTNHNDLKYRKSSQYSRSEGHLEEPQDFYHRSQEQNIRHARGPSQDTPPPPSSSSNGYSNSHREEAYHFNYIPNQHFQQSLNDNEIHRERMAHPQAPLVDEPSNSFTFQHERLPFGQRQDQPPPQPNKFPTANGFMKFPGSKTVHDKTNMVPIPMKIPQPSAVAIIVPGANGNSTLFIEYDISDNDVTYETIVEIDDVPDTLINSIQAS